MGGVFFWGGGGPPPPTTLVTRLNDTQLGWLLAAGLFNWIRTRSEQAIANGWDSELALRQTALTPEPWDAAAVEAILPKLGELPGVDWSKPIGAWSKDAIVKFLTEATTLIHAAMIARDVGGGVASKSKSLEEMQRVASAETGNGLMTPDEANETVL